MSKVSINKKKKEIIVDKIKSIGIILAVFLSFWTWLYTYKLDSGKFWAGLIISVFTGWLIFPIFIVWIWAILDTSLKDKDMYENYSKWKKK